MSESYAKTKTPEPYRSSDNYDVAVYRGDDLVHSETVKSAAAFLGVQKRTITYHLTPSGIRRAERTKKQHTVLRIVRI